MHFSVTKVDEVFLQVHCDLAIARELSNYFSFFIPGYKFMPAFKSRMWDGKIRLFSIKTGRLYLNLWYYLKEFADSNGYTVDFHPDITATEVVTDSQLDTFLDSLQLPFKVRDYQKSAIKHAVTFNRSLFVCPTGSGKTILAYSLIRWYGVKTLLIVPDVGLIHQTASEFAMYAKNDPSFDAAKEIHLIYSGQPKEAGSQVFISTWQSLYKMPPEYFEQFDLIIGDEAHTAKATSLKGLMEKSTTCKYKFGLTGTLDGTQTHKLILEGLFGITHNVITTKELMDNNHLANLKIKAVMLKYDATTCKKMARKGYPQEIDFIINCPERNKCITDLTLKLKGNTLVLFQYVDKHGKILYKMISEAAGDTRKVFYVSGETKGELRNEIRKVVDEEKNAIIVASLGVFSTGINIKNLENLVFATPSKARIKLLQSIGRILRIGRSDKATMYDIVDDLSHLKWKNYALNHFSERLNTYNEQKFDYKIFKVALNVGHQ